MVYLTFKSQIVAFLDLRCFELPNQPHSDYIINSEVENKIVRLQHHRSLIA